MNEEKSLIEKIMNEPQPIPRKVPDYMRKKGGIWYWTGAMIMITFFYEVITGVILLFYYQPSNAYNSTISFLTQPFGTIILTTHLYGAYLMIAFVYIHLLRNLFVGSYKKPRGSQWLTGVLLLILTVAAGYFGYSLTGDVLSADATDVGRGIAAATPFIGSYLEFIFFGAGTSIELFQRLEAWHIIIAGTIFLLFAIHFYMAEYNTIMPDPKEANYKAPLIDKDDKNYKPWYPYNFMYMMQIAFSTLALILIIPSAFALIPNIPPLLSPFPQVSPTSPLASQVPPYPPWFLLFVYKELDFQFASVIGPFWAVAIFTGMPLIYLFLIPLIDRNNDLKPSRRPLIIATGIVGIFYYVALSIWGAFRPGVPVPNSLALIFFVIPLVIMVPLIYYLAGNFEKEKYKNPNAWKIMALVSIAGFFGFLSGMSIYSLISTGSALSLGETVASLVFLALTILAIYAVYGGVKINKNPIRMTGTGYTVFGAVYGLLAVWIFTMISFIPMTSTRDQAMIGIGLGIIFFISAVLTKIYRAYAYGE